MHVCNNGIELNLIVTFDAKRINGSFYCIINQNSFCNMWTKEINVKLLHD